MASHRLISTFSSNLWIAQGDGNDKEIIILVLIFDSQNSGNKNNKNLIITKKLGKIINFKDI